MLIRAATHDDVPEIARIHVESAFAASGSLAPASDAELARRVANWSRRLDDPECSPFVAETDGQIVGILSVGPARAESRIGELYFLYVLADWWGRGPGQLLLDCAHQELARAFSTALLSVLASNPRARRFHERNGSSLDTVVIEEHFGHPTEVARYTRKPSAVTTSDIAGGAVTSSSLADGAVTSAKVQDHSLTLSDIAEFSGQVTVDVRSVAVNSCLDQAVTITGRQASDMLVLQPSTNFTTGLVVMPIFDTASGNTFTVRVCNVTNAAIDPPSGSWGYAVFDQ